MRPAPILKLCVIAATLVIGAVVSYFALISDAPLPDHPILRGRNDLALHIAAFFALAAPLLLLRGSWRRTAAWLVAFAALIEIVQIFQPRRNADWMDLAGSAVGIALAAICVMGLRGIAALVAPSGDEQDE